MNYLDLLERIKTGPTLTKENWDFENVLLTTRELVERFEIYWSPEQIIPVDQQKIDRLFVAGLELVREVGIYCLPEKRVLRISSEELEAGIRNVPRKLSLGEGSDARELFPRRIMDHRPPLVWAGSPGTPIPEDIFLPMVMSWIQEPIVDLITCGSLARIDGFDVVTGEPTEIIATRRELIYLREGLRRCGRAGMGMLAAQSSLTELGDLAVSNPQYLRSCDAHLIPVLNELILDQSSMARVVNSIEYCMRNASLACVMVGGLGGGPPGAAIVQVASMIAANLVCKADYHILHPIHIRHVATSTREVMWVQSAVCQAFARNAPCIIVGDVYPKSGAMTAEVLYEVAANTIVLTVSGGHLEGVGSADGLYPNCSGLEARFMGQVGHTIAKDSVTLEEANKLVLQLLDRYEQVFSVPDGNPGVRFDRAYDLETLSPVPEWEKIYCEILDELQGLGLSL